MTRKFFGASLLCLTLVACGGEEAPKEEATAPQTDEEVIAVEETAPEAAPDSPPMVEITRVLGSFDGEVAGLGFTRSPDFGARGTLLAGNGEAGVAIIPLDEEATPSMRESENLRVVTLAATNAAGQPLVAVESQYPDAGSPGAPVLDLLTTSPSEDALIIVDTLEQEDLPGLALDLCFAGETLFRIGSGGDVTRIAISAGENGLSAETSTVETAPAIECAEAGEIAYLRGDAGGLIALDASGTEQGRTGAAPGTTGFAAMPLGSEDKLFFILPDGRVQVDETAFSFTIEGEPVTVTQLVMGTGNYGGAYREGVVGVLTSDNTLGVVSWLAIANALDLAVETGDAGTEASDEASVNVPAPQIDYPELPETEDVPE